jgi:zinc protease
MFKKFQLKNGLKVLLVESKKSPVVSVQMWVKTGSADERKGEEGISHFIEHLLFKGTRKFGVGEIAATVEGSGGELNAYTSFDQTVFYVTISKEFTDTALEVISDMMGFPLFDQAEINNEREVVIEEIKRGRDNPHRQASQLLFGMAYKKHPYGLPVIGFDRVIKKVSRKTLVNYYQSRYVPRNMMLLVVGDFDTKEMKAKVEGTFSEMKDLKLRRVARAREAKQTKPRIKVLKTSFEEAQVNIAWKIPKFDHKDIPALDVLALILGQGDSSRLMHRLRLDKPLVNSVSASSFTPFDPGFFAVSMSLVRENLETALPVLIEELYQMLSSPPQPEELAKAVMNLASEEFYSMETVDGMARTFGSYEHHFGDYKYFNQIMKAVHGLKPTDILTVARKYLRPETMTVTMTTPRGEREAAKILAAATKKFKAPPVQKTKATKQGKATRLKWKLSTKTGDGDDRPIKQARKEGVLILREAHDTPVISLRCAFRGGVRQEKTEQGGLTELLSRVWATETKSFSERQLYHEVEAMAASLSAFGGRNTVGVTLTTVSDHAEKAIELFQSVLLEPSFNTEIIEREKTIMLEQLKHRNDNPAQVAVLKFMQSMFGIHPYGRDPMGDEKSLRGLGPNELRAHYEKMVTRQNFVGVSSGDLSPKDMGQKIDGFLKRLSAGERIRDHFPFAPPQETVRLFEANEKEQTHIVYGFPGLTLTDPQRFSLQVLQSILAGQGGRLFIELRDKASLAYSVAPLRMEGLDGGYFAAYIGCSPEKGTKAITMMEAEFEKLCDKEVPESELERARRYLIGRHDIDLQRNTAVSSSLLFDEIYDIDFTETYRYAERIRAVSAKDVRNLARQLFQQKFVVSAIGRECPW